MYASVKDIQTTAKTAIFYMYLFSCLCNQWVQVDGLSLVINFIVYIYFTLCTYSKYIVARNSWTEWKVKTLLYSLAPLTGRDKIMTVKSISFEYGMEESAQMLPNPSTWDLT